ncbi:MAG TPA: trypsin-like peptidase domain-containing protein [Solirubrobacterales bacterium]|nr:trypsin-like peptidase domain-containing protein [Solirubrobacterales bacterium]
MKRLGALAALVLCLALLGGCGSSGDDSSSTGGGSATKVSKPDEPAPAPQVAIETSSPGFDATGVYREAAPGVVTIRSVFDQGAAEGSGFVLDEKGEIVTNAHVVTDESSGEREPAKNVYVEFPERNVVPAEIVGFDPFNDVALLKVAPQGLQLHPLELGNDGELQVGQPVAAIGSPFGEQHSLSVGVVSATDRSVKSLTRFEIFGAIQTDASINPGNSGGPLLDAGARVIGINQQIETNSGANDGVGFAVPVSAIKRSVAQLREDGTAEYAYLGVGSQTLYPQLARRLGLDTTYGSLLSEVVPGGPAEQAGLKGGNEEVRFQAAKWKAGGDVILAIDGQKIVEENDLARVVAEHRPGEKVTLTILHDNKPEQVELTLGKRPDNPSSS